MYLITLHSYINEVKRFYQQYLEIDVTGNRDEEFIIKELDVNRHVTVESFQHKDHPARAQAHLSTPAAGSSLQRQDNSRQEDR